MVQFHLPDFPPTHALSDFEFLQDPKDEASKLGTGSFGAVKLAREKTSGKLFAFKIVELTKITETDLFNLKSEIMIHKDLNHPHVIKFHGYTHHENLVYLILDYASHGNLYNYLQCKKRLTEKEVFRFFHQSCLAANYLHQKNVLHRDIKPENLLLDDDFNIKVCDFGWAAHNINQQRSTFCGTYEYMAPEIIREETYDYRVDIWALGVLLYELIHNRPPYKGRTLQEIRASLSRNQLTFDDKIHQDVKLLIHRTLDFNPENRIAIDQVLASAWINEHLEREINFRKSVYQGGEIIGRASRLNNVAQKLKIFDDEADPQPIQKPQLQLKPLDINSFNNSINHSFPIKTEIHAEEKETSKPTTRRVSKLTNMYSQPTDLVGNSSTNTTKPSGSALSILLQEGIISDINKLPQPAKKPASKRKIFDENLLSPVFNQRLDKVMGSLKTRHQTEYGLKDKENFNFKTQGNPSIRHVTEYGHVTNNYSFAHDVTSPNSLGFSRSITEYFPREGLTSLGGSPRAVFQEANKAANTAPKKKVSFGKDEGFSFKSLFEKVNILSACTKGHPN